MIEFLEPLAVSSKPAGKILIAPTKYRNPNNRIRQVLAMTLTADMQLGFIQNSSIARVLLLTAKNENFSKVQLQSYI